MAAAVLADLLGFVLILAGLEHWTIKPGNSLPASGAGAVPSYRSFQPT